MACAALGQLVIMDQATAGQMVGLSAALGVVGFLAPTLGLGIATLLAVASERPASVQIYSSPADGSPTA